MKKTFFLLSLFSVVLIVLLMTPLVFGQSAKDAVMALKKLEVKVGTGISYIDYSTAVADAKFPVKLFLESSESKSEAELSSSLQKAIEHYEFANSVWHIKFTCGTTITEYMHAGCNYSIFSKIMRDYPSVIVHSTFGQKSIGIDNAIVTIWEKAAQEVQIASDLLSKAELKAQSMKAENEELKQENVTLRKELETLKTKLADLQHETEKIKGEKEAKDKENDNLKTEIESLKNKAVSSKRKK